MPSFRVGKPRIRLELSGDTLLTGGSPYLIPWDVVSYEDPAVWDPLTPTLYTITKTGLWQVDFCLAVRTTSAQFKRVSLLVNGVLRSGNGSTSSSVGPQYYHCGLQDELVDTDQIEVELTSAGTVTVNQVGSYLAATRIGPERWT